MDPQWVDGRPRPVILLSGVVATLGVALSLLAGALLAARDGRAAEQQLERRTDVIAAAVAVQTRRYADTLSTVAAAAGALDPLSNADFARVTEPLARMRLPGASSIVFLVPARHDELAEVQAAWQARGSTGLVLDPVEGRREHIFTVLARGLDGKGRAPTGIDAVQRLAPALALHRARLAGRVAVSDTYQLIIDQTLPPDRRQRSFLLAAPVQGPADRAGHRPFLGWVAMGLRGQDFMGTTLQGAAQGLTDVTLHAGDDAAWAPVAKLAATAPGERRLHRRVRVAVADQWWELHVRASHAALSGGATSAAFMALGGGAALTLAVTALVWVLAGARARAHGQVLAATAELRAAERTSGRQTALLSAVLDGIADGVVAIDADGEPLLHNPTSEQLLGVGIGDGVSVDDWQGYYGMYTDDGIAPLATEDFPLARALAGEASEQVPMVVRNPERPEGIVVSVSARPLPMPDGRNAAVAVFHDITERTRAAQKLAEASARLAAELSAHRIAHKVIRGAYDQLAAQQEHLAQVLDAIDVTVVTCTADGRIAHANRAARDLLDITGTAGHIEDCLAHVEAAHPDGTPLRPAEAPMARALRGEAVDDEEIHLPLPGGGRRVVMSHARPLHDQAGRLTGAVASSYEITVLRDRENELSAYAGIVAHDLKSPLTVVGGFAEIVAERLDAHPSMQTESRLMCRILTATTRMRHLIDDLLSYAAARDVVLVTVDLDLEQLVDRVVHDRLSGFAADRGVAAPEVHVGALGHARADPTLLHQLFDNLIGNAIKYTAPGRSARIDITGRPDAEGRVRIEVADRGIGIPVGHHQAVFSDFHRAHPGRDYTGTGLGLAICSRIVARHGGRIGADDNPGGGTRIWFTLPAATHVQTGPGDGEPAPAQRWPARDNKGTDQT